MRIKLATPLIGEFPRYANVKLPDTPNGLVMASGGNAQLITEFLLYDGVLWASDFTPPTAPFTY